MKMRFVLLVLIGLSKGFAFAQHHPNSFCHPLDIPLELAGTFGEIRTNHLHSGFDLRTNKKEGYNVFAVGEGYVSRIKVSATGYGKALYIRHPNGFTSVYGHLKEYSKAIEEYTKRKQYENESFEADLFLKFDEIRIKKGEIIGLSGNTGGSENPHLHFELRDNETEDIINPFLFGYEVKDSVPPVISSVSIYPAYNSAVNSREIPLLLPVTKKNGIYQTEEPVKVYGTIGLGLECYDTGNKTDARNGIYSLDISIDGKRVYSCRFDRFSFDQTRFVNALIDYEAKIRSARTIIKTRIAPNNRLPMPGLNLGKGIYPFTDGKVHEVSFLTSDFNGNRSELRLKIQSVKEKSRSSHLLKSDPVSIFPYSQENTFSRSDVSVRIPAFALYDTLNFEYFKGEIPKGAFSYKHSIHNPYTPLQFAYQLSIQPVNLPEPLREKALIALIKNDATVSQGGKWEKGYVSTKTRLFGDFVVMVDTTAPTIVALNIKDNADLSNEDHIKIKVRDELSGIRTYRATINGAWILMEYDIKSSSLSYKFDEHVGKGRHLFELRVSDEKNNSSKYTAYFIR